LFSPTDNGVPAFFLVTAVAGISAVIGITAVASSTAVAGVTVYDASLLLNILCILFALLSQMNFPVFHKSA
jgi:hypothetical protein